MKTRKVEKVITTLKRLNLSSFKEAPYGTLTRINNLKLNKAGKHRRFKRP